MSPLRLTPSLLDAYRLYCDFDFKSLPDLEAQIKGEPITPTPAMLLGAAFHKIAEGEADHLLRDHEESGTSADRGAWSKDTGFYSVDGFLFDAASADDALEPLAGGVSEVWCSRVLEHVPHSPLLRGRADSIVGATPWEIKTKNEEHDPERHAASLQWQCYLHMLEADECRYLLVRLEEGKDCWRVRDADPLPLFRYVGIEDHINQWAARMMHFCESRGLLPYLDKE